MNKQVYYGRKKTINAWFMWIVAEEIERIQKEVESTDAFYVVTEKEL